MLISWSEHFTVGIAAVDDGHALVIDTINQLDRAGSAAESAEVVERMLPILRQHLADQFEIEEALLRSAEAPLRDAHESEHRRIMTVLDMVDYRQASGGNAASLLMLNLVCFLVSHLRGTDGDSFADGQALRRAA